MVFRKDIVEWNSVIKGALLFCRGGKYAEDDAKAVMVQILNVVAFCHLQGVVHRDLKPEVGDLLILNCLYF